MKRDITLAIIVGFIFGVIFALIITNLPKIVREGIKLQSYKPIATPTIIQVKNTTSAFELTLDLPKDESISDTKIIEVSGSTNPHMTVFIESEIDQMAVESNDAGVFAGKIILSEGVNTIFLTAYDEAGNSITKNLNIFYTTEKL